MGSSEHEGKQAISAMESEHQSRTRDGLRIETTTSSREENQIAHRKSLSSQSSFSSTSSGSPFELDITCNSRLFPEDEVASPNTNSDNQLASGDPGNEISGQKTNPEYTSGSDSGSPTNSPPPQVMMEPSINDYRIPPSVFARNPSSIPMEWSVASNESLFSIHMGNMSFTRDHVNWFKSGELGLPGDPSIVPRIDSSGNQNLKNHIPLEDDDVTESKAAETMREVIKENEANSEVKFRAKKSRPSSSFRRSDASGTSVKSFAFPILTGDNKSDPSSPKQNLLRHQTPKTNFHQELPQKTPPETAKPETKTTVMSKWLSCFPCCTSCS